MRLLWQWRVADDLGELYGEIEYRGSKVLQRWCVSDGNVRLSLMSFLYVMLSNCMSQICHFWRCVCPLGQRSQTPPSVTEYGIKFVRAMSAASALTRRRKLSHEWNQPGNRNSVQCGPEYVGSHLERTQLALRNATYSNCSVGWQLHEPQWPLLVHLGYLTPRTCAF